MPDWTARAAAMGFDPKVWVQVEGVWLPVISGGDDDEGGGTVTTVVNVPGPSENELKIQEEELKLTRLMVQHAERQSKLLEESFPQSSKLLKEQIALTQTLVDQAGAEVSPRRKQIDDLSEERALAILKGEAPPLSSQQEGFIEDAFQAAETEAKTNLRTFAEELAATRGLKLTDTPIGDTVLRETTRLAGGLAGAKATAKLDVSQTQQAFQEGVRQFQENLRQQAFLNRVALTGGLPTVGSAFLQTAPQSLALPTATNANILDRMQAGRLASASTTRDFTQFSSPSTLSQVGMATGAVGNLLSGVGAVGYGFNMGRR